MNNIVDPPMEHAFWINAAAMTLGLTFTLPLVGLLSDYCGRLKIMGAGALCVGVFGPLCVFVISRGSEIPAFFAQFGLGLMLSLYTGPMSAWLVERFPPRVRLTSASLGYDLVSANN